MVEYKHRDGIIRFYPEENKIEIEGISPFQKEKEEKKPFKGRVYANPYSVFEAYKLIRQAVEGQDIEQGKVVFFNNGFKRMPYFAIGKPANVSEGFIKRKGVFTLFAENTKENMASRFILTLNDLISLLSYLRQMPMRFSIGLLTLERKNDSFYLINPFLRQINLTEFERIKIALKQSLSGKDDIIPAYIGDYVAIFKRDNDLIVRTDLEEVKISDDLKRELWTFLT